MVTLRDLGIANSGVFNIALYLRNNYCESIIAESYSRVQHIRIIVIIFVQGAAILQLSPVQCAVLFKVISLTLLLLSSALFMAEIFLYGSRCFVQLTGLLIRLIVFRIFLRQLFLQRCDLLFKIFHLRYRA